MAGVKISQLTDGGDIQAADTFPIARASTTRKIFGSVLLNRFAGLDSQIAALSAADGQFVLRAGDTMAGFLTLNGDPTALLHAATKQYVDNRPSVPTGLVAPFAMNTAPTGWVICNGDVVTNGVGVVQSTTANFAALYAVLGTTYGAAGTLPDLRGYFVRGVDLYRGIDPGRVFGSSQMDSLSAHTHTGSTTAAGDHTHSVPTGGGSDSCKGDGGTAVGRPWGCTTGAAGAHSHGMALDATGGAETRPKNVALLYCIKY